MFYQISASMMVLALVLGACMDQVKLKFGETSQGGNEASALTKPESAKILEVNSGSVDVSMNTFKDPVRIKLAAIEQTNLASNSVSLRLITSFLDGTLVPGSEMLMPLKICAAISNSANQVLKENGLIKVALKIAIPDGDEKIAETEKIGEKWCANVQYPNAEFQFFLQITVKPDLPTASVKPETASSPSSASAVMPEAPSFNLVAVSGDNQSALVSSALALAFKGKATSKKGVAFKNLAVSFKITKGDGTLASTGGSTVTAEDGSFESPILTLGNTGGINQVTAYVYAQAGASKHEKTLTFTAYGRVITSIVKDPDWVASSGAAGTLSSSALVALVKDQDGQALSGIPVIWHVKSGGGSLASQTSTTAIDGKAQSPAFTFGTSAGSNVVTASIQGTSLAVDFTVVSSAGPANKLSFKEAVPNTLARAAITPTLKVVILDQFGNQTTGTNQITLAIDTNPANGAISATSLSVLAIAGEATFANVKIDLPADGYRLSATAADLIPATSNSFMVTANILVVGPSTVYNSTCVPYKVTFTDSDGNAVAAPSNTELSLSAIGDSDFASFSQTCAPSSFSNLNGALTIPAALSSAKFYLKPGAPISETLHFNSTVPWVNAAAKTVTILAQDATSGAIDTSFNINGKVTTDLGFGHDKVLALAIQNDGKILAAGYATNSNTDFALARYNEDGSLDSSFGTSGKVMTDINGNDEARAMKLLDDGKILVAGFSTVSQKTVTVARYTSAGVLDSSFGTAGITKVTKAAAYDEVANGIDVQSDGKIVLGGYVSLDSGSDFLAVRLTSNGALDTTFNSPNGRIAVSIGSNSEEATAVRILSSDKILLGGNFGAGDGGGAVVRLNANGTLDSTFGAAGTGGTGAIGGGSTVLNNVPAARWLGFSAMDIQKDGKILLQGRSWHGGSGPVDDCRMQVVRLNSDGDLDTTTYGASGVFSGHSASGYRCDTALSGALHADGKFSVVGSIDVQNAKNFGLVRAKTNGTIDTDFDGNSGQNLNGYISTDFSADYEEAFAIAIQPDGRIISAGFATYSGTTVFALMRHWP